MDTICNCTFFKVFLSFKVLHVILCLYVTTNNKVLFCFSLYTLDGHKISEPSQLDDNGQYVAVGRERLYVFHL